MQKHSCRELLGQGRKFRIVSNHSKQEEELLQSAWVLGTGLWAYTHSGIKEWGHILNGAAGAELGRGLTSSLVGHMYHQS
jgi:hypothetical protein